MPPMSFRPVTAGLLGCGTIAPAYLRNLTTLLSGAVDVVACADTVESMAQQRATEFGIPRALTPDQLLADPSVELVINLTPAPIHHRTSLAILQAGKHLFSEKPLALTREDGREILDAAAAAGLRVAGAADTFLGGGLQVARRLIDTGEIGAPLGGDSLIALPLFNMARYFTVFHGPVMDIVPYYLGAFVTLLGPVTRVTAMGAPRFPDRVSMDAADAGSLFTPKIPSTVAAALQFAGGPVCTLFVTSDASQYFPRTTLHGTNGTLLLPDSNFYFGPVTLRRKAQDTVVGEAEGFGTKHRGLGVAELAIAIREDREPRASGALMYHLLDVMLGINESAATGQPVDIASSVERPEPFDSATLPAPLKAVH